MTVTNQAGGARTWQTADAVHIDVRGLSPPAPMVAILRLLDGGQIESALVAHLDRPPIYLYPELDDRGWRYAILPPGPGNSGEVLLRMERAAP